MSTPLDLTYYTIEQVAEMTGMTKDWLWKQCKDKKIPHHRMGQRFYRFTLGDLEALMVQTAVVPSRPEERPLPVPTRHRRSRA